MTPTDLDTLAIAWLTYQRNWWSYEAIGRLCKEAPEVAWSVILRLVAAAEDEEMLQTVGAGPLEDLLQDHGTTVLQLAEAESHTNPKLRKALEAVWLPRSSDPVTQRLVALGCQLLREQ